MRELAAMRFTPFGTPPAATSASEGHESPAVIARPEAAHANDSTAASGRRSGRMQPYSLSQAHSEGRSSSAAGSMDRSLLPPGSSHVAPIPDHVVNSSGPDAVAATRSVRFAAEAFEPTLSPPAEGLPSAGRDQSLTAGSATIQAGNSCAEHEARHIADSAAYQSPPAGIAVVQAGSSDNQHIAQPTAETTHGRHADSARSADSAGIRTTLGTEGRPAHSTHSVHSTHSAPGDGRWHKQAASLQQRSHQNLNDRFDAVGCNIANTNSANNNDGPGADNRHAIERAAAANAISEAISTEKAEGQLRMLAKERQAAAAASICNQEAEEQLRLLAAERAALVATGIYSSSDALIEQLDARLGCLYAECQALLSFDRSSVCNSVIQSA